MSQVTIADFFEYAKLNTEFREYDFGVSTDLENCLYPYIWANFEMWGIEFELETRISELITNKKVTVLEYKLAIEGYRKEIRFSRLDLNFDLVVKKISEWAKEREILEVFAVSIKEGHFEMMAFKLNKVLSKKQEEKSKRIKI